MLAGVKVLPHLDGDADSVQFYHRRRRVEKEETPAQPRGDLIVFCLA